jgi:hypothetical protein
MASSTPDPVSTDDADGRATAWLERVEHVMAGMATASPGRELQALADGVVATFTVDAVERYPKDAFPTSRVYGNTTDRAEIRLITCGGDFDRGTGHYVDNVVVYGHLVA